MPMDKSKKTLTKKSKSIDILEGKTLEKILIELVDVFGWHELSLDIKINCFIKDPSIKSSLTFLRRTPWARKKVENLYIRTMKRQQRRALQKNSEKQSN
jgi:uncharacterized protein (DUF2132 family)